MSTGKENVTIS